MVSRWNVGALGLAVSIGCVSSAWAAGDIVWDPSGGVGDLSDPANWVGGVLPDATDTAVFNTPGGSTTANLTQPTFPVSGISVLAGDTTFDLSGRTISSLAIGVGLTGDTAALLLQNGRLNGQSLSAGDGAGSDVDLIIGTGGRLTLSGALTALSDTSVVIDGGIVTVGSMSLADAIDFQAGTLTVNSNLAWADLGAPASLSLVAGHNMEVVQTFTFASTDTLTLNGGRLSVGVFAGTGQVDYQSGDLLSDADIGIGTGRLLASNVSIGAGDLLSVDGVLTVDAGFGLSMSSGQVDLGILEAAGTYTQTGGFATLDELVNTGGVTVSGGTLTVGQILDNTGGFAFTGPATLRLTGEQFEVDAGGDWGSSYTLSADAVLEATVGAAVGVVGPATLTLDANAQLRTPLLTLGGDATLNLDPTASIRANFVTLTGTTDASDLAAYDIDPWTASFVTVNTLGTLTHNNAVTTTLFTAPGGSGRVEVNAGTLVYDLIAIHAPVTTVVDFEVAAGAELRILDDNLNSHDTWDHLILNPAGALLNHGVLRLNDVELLVGSAYSGEGRVVLENFARITMDPGAPPVTIHDFTASAGTDFRRVDFSAGTAELNIHRSDGSAAYFGDNVNVTFHEDVTLTGGGIAGDLTNLGILRVAAGALFSDSTGSGPTTTQRLNAAGALILLGDGSTFNPQGALDNLGMITVQGTDAGVVSVRSLTGDGVFDAGLGSIDVNVNNAGTWDGQFLGGAGSSTRVFINNALLTFSSAGLIDTAGDLTLESGGATTVIAAPLHVDGLLTLSDNIIEIADASTAFEITDLAIGHDTIVRVTSGQTIDADSLTILDSGASNAGRATIETAGQFNIGAGGISDGGQFYLRGGGTMNVAGTIDSLGFIQVDGSRFELAGSLSMERGEDIGLINGGEFVVLAGGSLSGIDIDGDSSGARLINHGTITIDDGEEWRDLAIENHGILQVVDGEGFNVRNAISFLLTGDFTAEQNTSIQLGNFEQTATGDLTAAGIVRLLHTNTFAGRVDLSGGELEIFSTLVFEPGADVVSLGNVTVHGGFLDGKTGGLIMVDDFDLVESLNSHLPTPDSIYVQGQITSAANKHISPSVIAAGLVSPGRTSDNNHNWLRFRRKLTLEDGASVQLEIIRDRTFDWIEVAQDFTIEEGVTLELVTEPDDEDSLPEGSLLRLVKTSAPIIGAFETVEGLTFGDGLQWHLTYDNTGLLAEVRVAGDIDGNGFVGAADLELLLANWGGELNAGTGADLTGDGFVGDEDLDLVMANWGNGTVPSPTVPEPGTLAVLGLMLLAPRRRRSR